MDSHQGKPRAGVHVNKQWHTLLAVFWMYLVVMNECTIHEYNTLCMMIYILQAPAAPSRRVYSASVNYWVLYNMTGGQLGPFWTAHYSTTHSVNLCTEQAHLCTALYRASQRSTVAF